jgi:hypothetical protein
MVAVFIGVAVALGDVVAVAVRPTDGAVSDGSGRTVGAAASLLQPARTTPRKINARMTLTKNGSKREKELRCIGGSRRLYEGIEHLRKV